MIHLRRLEKKDAPLMLEWMHDASVQRGLRRDMGRMTLDDAYGFIEGANISDKPGEGDSLHYAIADVNDEYLGTISLKDIEISDGHAEYAIVLRSAAQGRGTAFEASGLLLKEAFDRLKLHRVYLAVYADNDRAIKLYEKCGFKYEGEFRDHLKRDGKLIGWKWYGMLAEEYDRERFEKGI